MKRSVHTHGAHEPLRDSDRQLSLASVASSQPTQPLPSTIAPYYQDENVTLYHGDCREVMPALATQSVSLLLTDPPYGQETQINRRREKLAKIAGDDGSLDVPGAITQACRLLRRGRHAYVFGPADLATTPLCAAVQLIWHKQVIGTGDLALPWGLAHEPITFAVYEPSRANRSKGYGRLAARLRQGSVISCQRIQGAATGRHPNEKPVPLLRQLIESSSLFGEIVMDPFAGSGSTLEAAALECRSAIGIEIEERFCQMAAERLAHARRSI